MTVDTYDVKNGKQQRNGPGVGEDQRMPLVWRLVCVLKSVCPLFSSHIDQYHARFNHPLVARTPFI